ncbi:MAG: tyrosine--tRNA ligase [Deltaproteobacteria bacterium]|nr:tyrosine--tRNA ligase [Deltaproteobacteria bacterium]
MTKFAPVAEQLELLLRHAVDVQTLDDLRKKLDRSRHAGQPLTIKVGFDPTAPDLHLGHTVLMHKMRQFQSLGHRVIFVIGDFTASIGDPTGRSKTRPPLSREQIESNATTYRRQLDKILDRERTEVRFNREWLGPLDFSDVIRLASKYTVAQMLERDDYQKRYQANLPIAVHEFLYPLAQAYDSVALQADIELGGTDQLFNLLVGRSVMQAFGLEPQVIMTTPILEGTDARVENGRLVGNKMSKSLGNYIGVEEPPREQFGKLMRICDELMWRYYDLLSNRPLSDLDALRRQVKSGQLNPKQAKSQLAEEIVARYHGPEVAAAEARWFEENIGKKDALPDDLEEIAVDAGGPTIALYLLIARAGLESSNGAARRLISQGGVHLDGQRHSDPNEPIGLGSYTVRAGKKRFARVHIR